MRLGFRFPAIDRADRACRSMACATPEAKQRITEWLESSGLGQRQVQYKLRDWLFSRQRYWGEPFPILHGPDGQIRPVDEADLPVELPEMQDFHPAASDDPDAPPRPPLGRAPESWRHVEVDGVRYERELNTMPQWAGSCWYYLRFLDPGNDARFVGARGRAVLDASAGSAVGCPRAAPGRRPVRRRRRARGAAPAVRALLAQGALRPGARQHARAVRPAVQPGIHPGLRLPGRARHVRRCRGRRGARRRLLLPGQAGHARPRQDGQEPQERGQPGRDLRAVRLRHAPALRDVHGAARRLQALGDARHHRHAPLPAARVAELHGGGRTRGARSGSRTPSPLRSRRAWPTARSRP